MEWKKPRLSKLASQIPPSATLALSARAKAMKARGIDVIDLSVGQPDFNTPEAIVEAAFEAVRGGATGYTPTPGTPELRAAVAEMVGRDYRLEVSSDNVIVSPGAKYSLAVAMNALVGPGDEVLVPAPYWVSYPNMVTMAGAEGVLVKTTLEQGFRLDPASLEERLNERTKLLVLNSPSNPTGVGYDEDSLKAIGEVLARFPAVWVLCDDIYRKLVYGKFRHVSLARACPDLAHRCVFVDGVSKAYAMTGWRIGFTVGPKELIGAMTRLQGHETSCPAAVSQAAALAAITGDDLCVKEMLEAFTKRRDRLLARLSEVEGVITVPPDGAFYVFSNIEAYLEKKTPAGDFLADDIALGNYLLEEAHVAAVPGTAFGSPGHLRMSYATSEERLMEAMDRVSRALDNLKS